MRVETLTITTAKATTTNYDEEDVIYILRAFPRVQCQEAGGVRTRRSSAQSEAGIESYEGKDRRSQFPQIAPDEGPCSDLAGHSGIYLPLPVS